MRGGKDYNSEWGKRMRGDGPYAWQIGRRFEMAARRLGLEPRQAQTQDRPFHRLRQHGPAGPLRRPEGGVSPAASLSSPLERRL